ncbi:hypothetical protein BDY24DRAFT_383437 [Mrakia frigida]|uniref:uncharacterized protein n=1 Tax=Mrakia frigida TaxID=29902 RepID=UPI003FCBF558
MERRQEEREEEERDCVDPHWTRSPGGGLSLGAVVEEDEPQSPASSTFGAKLKHNHSRTSSSSSGTSPLLLVHIRKPYAGPFTDTTSFTSDDISPTSCPIPLPPVDTPRNLSNASDYSQTSFSTTPESPARVSNPRSSLPNGNEIDRSGSPIGSERTVVPSHLSTRNLSSASSDDGRSTLQPSSPAVEQRFRFASIEASSVPPRTSSPTRIKYAHSMAANRRGSTNRKGSYVVREGVATGYPLRSALKGGKAKAKAARPFPSAVRRISSKDVGMNGRNTSLTGNGGRNSILLGNNSPTKRNSFLANSGRFPSNTYTGSSSSLRTSISSSAGTTSPRRNSSLLKMNGINGHAIKRKPSPQQNGTVDLASLPPSPAQSPPSLESEDGRSFSRVGSMCAEGYAVIGGAMFSVTLRPMDEKGAMVMGTREFKAAGPLFKLASAH